MLSFVQIHMALYISPKIHVYKNARIFAHKTQIILVHVNYNI